ncbi:MAG: hypothetical protein KBS63_03640 [Clostridiales bacterium]|nr:hypothetical protein [Candidatus Crickella caballi]
MARKSNNIGGIDMSKAGRSIGGELAADLLKALAVGLVGGIATIAGAQKAGEGIEKLQERWEQLSEEEQARYRKAVEEATANDIDIDYTIGNEIEAEYMLHDGKEEE